MAEFETAARPYARAFFEMAQEEGKLDAWQEGLTLAAAVASVFLIAAIQGWAFTRMTWPERILSFLAGACIIWPDLRVQLAGVALAILVGGVTMLRTRGKRGEQTT